MERERRSIGGPGDRERRRQRERRSQGFLTRRLGAVPKDRRRESVRRGLRATDVGPRQTRTSGGIREDGGRDVFSFLNFL